MNHIGRNSQNCLRNATANHYICLSHLKNPKLYPRYCSTYYFLYFNNSKIYIRIWRNINTRFLAFSRIFSPNASALLVAGFIRSHFVPFKSVCNITPHPVWFFLTSTLKNADKFTEYGMCLSPGRNITFQLDSVIRTILTI